MQVELDIRFFSQNDWLEWSKENSYVYDPSFSRQVGDRIKQNGLIEPLTGVKFEGHEVFSGTSNWREELIAGGVNSRGRAVFLEIKEKTVGHSSPAIYGAEAITPFALRLRGCFSRYIGSEYIKDAALHNNLFPICHEDLTNLSFPEGVFDLVTTNEVLEHVHSIDLALREVARVLKPSGWHVGTHPFRFMDLDGDVRAKMDGSVIVYLKQAEFHGNPMDTSGGSLVFETPGWNILNRAREIGFRQAYMRFIASEKYGILSENTGIFVLCLER
jgi:SAM-dependent methyltransferase